MGVHRRLVRLERDQRVLCFDAVAGFDEDPDDRHALKPMSGTLTSIVLIGTSDQAVHGAGFDASIPFLIAPAACGRSTPSSASAFSAATVT